MTQSTWGSTNKTLGICIQLSLRFRLKEETSLLASNSTVSSLSQRSLFKSTAEAIQEEEGTLTCLSTTKVILSVIV